MHRRSLYGARRNVHDFSDGLRIGLAASTARFYGYSISPEDGLRLVEPPTSRRPGSTADETTLTLDGRRLPSGLRAHQIVAIRGAAGASSGTPGGNGHFSLGGALPAGDVLDFGREAVSLLRGFPSQSFAGTHVALVSTDYRWPIARHNEAPARWPLFLQTIHAAVFADAGETRGRTAFAPRAPKPRPAESSPSTLSPATAFLLRRRSAKHGDTTPRITPIVARRTFASGAPSEIR